MYYGKLKYLTLIIISVAALSGGAQAQRGDRGDERAKMKLPDNIKVPPSPVVPPEKALGTFQLKEGFKMELVAAEPLVNRPVDIAWDADGRLWVAEMTNYMPDVDATNETDPVGTIAVLEDTDGDSIMDKRTVFLDGLVLPRTVAPVAGGVLVGAPPELLFCRDTDGDLVCDEKIKVDDYGSVNGNVEHMTNVLRPQRDNWFIMGKDDRQYRFRNGEWEIGKGKGYGQWGISPDDWGRVYFNSNSNMLSEEGGAKASNSVYPIRPTPGVNRGYGWIHKSDRLGSVTSACGPGVYRGGLFPEGFEGNVYACAPCVNAVKRIIPTEDENGKVKLDHAYKDSEFLASTDERFRPVNIRTGPDGGLYVVDLYHGILQHRTYVTTWLRQQILDRGLDKPMGTGRIYRILPVDVKPGPSPKLEKAPVKDLIAALEHKNGWWRDTAQRLLVERGDASAIPALQKLVTDAQDPRTRFHALWTLEGMGAVDENSLAASIKSDHPKIREAAMRIAIADDALAGAISGDVVALLDDESEFVRKSAVQRLAKSDSEAIAGGFRKVISETDSESVLKAAAESIESDEVSVLKERLGDKNWADDKGSKGRTEFIKKLSQNVVDRGRPAECDELVALLDEQGADSWKLQAMVSGTKSSRRVKDKKLKPVRLAGVPEFIKHLDEKDLKVVEQVLVWPGRDGYVVAEGKEFKLDANQLAQLNQGKTLFNVACAVCHKPDGTGQEGLAPPLVGSEWVEGNYDHMVRITLNGLKGPIEVAGKKYELEMPPLGALGDDQIASVLSYIQREFGDATMPPLTADDIKKAREANKDRKGPWTAKELEEEG